MNKETILVVDDQVEVLNMLRRLLLKDYNVVVASGGEEGLDYLKKEPVAVILSDQRMPGMDGVTFLNKARKIRPESVRIMITGYADIEATIGAVNQAGIYQYISKPFEPEDLKQIVKKAIQKYHAVRNAESLQSELLKKNKELEEANLKLYKQFEEHLDLGNLIGNSPPMLKVLKLVKKVVNTPTTVLLLGETGTGKELLAKIIHYNSSRKDNAFIVQNCGAIPDTLLQSELFGHIKGSFTGAINNKQGLFEIADKGTIFLDEIGDTSPALQLGLLRALQEGEIKPVGSAGLKKVDVRIIAATNKNLEEEVKSGRFREDLYYRLSVFPILLPPLRERQSDIPDLVYYFIEKYAGRINKKIKGIDKEIMQVLMNAAFPGNIRELENEIERLITLADENEIITSDLLSPRFSQVEIQPVIDQHRNLKTAIEYLERKMISQALKNTKGNILRSARELGISRVGLHKMLNRHGINAESFKSR
ncbi:MAG: sigma-54-dependent Fis family transcriptional regulator [Calditrichaceae bacterium]|nr:sigma-54-dependent Fis family transcriptional regulator [Calditrichaceae bacterium]